jgi:RHS repeat-associated protein
MSQKSGTSGGIISLPQGGGAMQGIGEKFSPDLHTGTGNFSIPLALPPGRNGFQPQLSLGYSTGSGNGPFGLGWGISVPGVSRQTLKGVPRYDDAKDIFLLSGAEDLVPIPGGSAGATRYRPRTEGLFARIEHHHGSGDDYWEVWSADGLVSVYGTPGAAGNDPAVAADPDRTKRAKVFAWKLSETRDSFGNRIVYEYERDLGVEGPRHWDQLYLKRIRYADNTENGATRFLVSVTFVYEDRPDPFSEYRAGFEIRTRRRCVRIEVRTHAERDRLTHTYHLRYLDQVAPSRPAGEGEGAVGRRSLPPNGVSFLSRFEVTGHDGEVNEALPPLTFDYTRFASEGRRFSKVAGADLPARSLASPDLELADLFGRGLPDILEMNGSVRYWRNLGGGRFDRPREMKDAPAGVGLADPGVQMIDANGDGRLDLLVTNGVTSGYYPLRFGGLWDRSFQPYHQAPSFNLEDPEVRLVDLDGDGVTDAIRSGNRLECFFNDAIAGWNATRFVERRALEDFPNVNFSDPRVKFGDMSGDGLQDIVLAHDGCVEYWPSLGRGDWGKRVTMARSPSFPYGYDPKRILIGDVDGDGFDDIVYVDDGRVTLWINQSGNSWSDPIEIKGTPPVTDLHTVRLVDLFGGGIAGVLWSADAGGPAGTNLFFLDFTSGVKPYLLDEMDNHTGAITRVEYASSTRFYLEDERRAETRWKTPLPFPVQVVSRVEVIDSLSGGKLTTVFRYHHGYWDGAEREFRGFGLVEQLDSENFEEYNASRLHGEQTPFARVTEQKRFSPPTLTKTWFHHGPVGDEFGEWEEIDYRNEYWPDDPPALARPPAMEEVLKNLPRRARRDALRALRGNVLRTELYALDSAERQGRPYTVTESLYGVREEAPPGPDEGDRLRVFFPHVMAQRATQWERGDDPMTQFTFTDGHDAYGKPQSQIAIAVPRGRDYRRDVTAGEPYLATQTVTTYAQRDDAQRYLIGRVAQTTAYEIISDGPASVFALHRSILGGSAARRVIGQTLNFYDGPAFQGLSFGRLGEHGVLSRTESLVLTPEILKDAYRSGDTAQAPPELPPYLAPNGTPAWTAEYPQEFRDHLAPLAGYVYQSGGPRSPYETGYFVVGERRRYDCQSRPDGQGRGLLLATRDPLERETTVAYDAYDLLPTRVTDPAGLTTEASYDYRVLQPREVTDPNGNRSAFTFTPLGLLSSAAVMGKVGETAGDRPDAPGSRLVYDFMAFAERRQPISVRTIRRIHHINETDAPLPDREETVESVEYSDGFGRLLQTRTQAEDITFGDPVFGDSGLPADQSLRAGDAVGRQRAANDPLRVIVSGWQTYDNKGQVVEKYEPFFSTGFDYAPPAGAQFGQKATMFYDPRGQVIGAVNPDGSEQRVIFGAPIDLTTPEAFNPTPWEAYTYDANDNAGRTHGGSSTSDQRHWNTPASIVIDALGRTVAATARNGSNPADWPTTRSTYDIQGNLLTVIDAPGRVAFKYVYDLAKHPLRTESIDAGLRRAVVDALGNPVEGRDSKGALALHAYDALHRPIRLWARDGSGQPLSLRERMVYGDASDSGLTLAQAVGANLLGKLYQLYDEAGAVTVESYDFKGNALEKARQVISDAALLAVFNPAPPNWQATAFRVDWEPPAGMKLADHAKQLLDEPAYRTSVTYDALNRVKTMRYPQDVEGKRKELRPHYNRAGALERARLDGKSYVEHIAYNAKGQRTLIVYGNGVMTRHAYDPKTFRLARLRTERYTTPATGAYRPAGAPLQDFAYRYDLAGNITAILDRTPDSGVLNTPLGKDALDRVFVYDPLYRLLSATGRECDTPPLPPWMDEPRGVDLTRTRRYTEQYQYDTAGNLTRLRRQSGDSVLARELALGANSNRLAKLTIGQTNFDYTYDANGNLIQETTSRHFEWDYADRMRVFRTQTGNAEPSVHAHYLYDAAGQRVKKLARKQGGKVEVTVYVDGVFEHQRVVQGAAVQQNNTLHVMDDQSRIALVRVGAPFPDDTTPAVKFHLGDHLGSGNLALDDTGALVNREEYTPYGETSFGSFAKKRYRFTGKERDEESGFYYHGARYYAPWLGRWVSCDPKAMIDGTNLYTYTQNNPVNLVDPGGTQSVGAGGASSVPTDNISGGGAEGSSGADPYNPAPKTSGTSSGSTQATNDIPDVSELIEMGPIPWGPEPPYQGTAIGPDLNFEREQKAADLNTRWRSLRSSLLATTGELGSLANGVSDKEESARIAVGANLSGIVGAVAAIPRSSNRTASTKAGGTREPVSAPGSDKGIRVAAGARVDNPSKLPSPKELDPSFPDLNPCRYENNCVRVANRLDRWLGGSKNTAPVGNFQMSKSRYFKEDAVSIAAVKEQLEKAGPGSRGILTVGHWDYTLNGGKGDWVAHVVNVVNWKGRVIAIDGQNMTYGSVTAVVNNGRVLPITGIWFRRTN